MANNRMWLRCTFCHEATLLGKYYPISWGWGHRDLNPFFDKHDKCGAELYTGDISAGAEFYDLVYESQDNMRYRVFESGSVIIDLDTDSKNNK